MAANYDETLPTDRDHVRLLIGDTDTANAKLTDGEITAILAEETVSGTGLKYAAAATAASMLKAKWESEGEGLVGKKVENLDLSFGVAQASGQSLDQYIGWLRKMATDRSLTTSSKVFRVL